MVADKAASEDVSGFGSGFGSWLSVEQRCSDHAAAAAAAAASLLYTSCWSGHGDVSDVMQLFS